MKTKQELRDGVVALRRGMKPQTTDKYSRTIAAGVVRMVDFTNAQRVHIYNPITYYNEVQTIPLVQMLREQYPHIEIVSPGMSHDEPMPTEKFDVIIVPLVAFDDRCHRIGFGVGWYDKFLATQPQAKKVGLGFWLQRVAHVPNESHDQQLDMIITEALVYAKN